MRIPTITLEVASEALEKRRDEQPWNGSSFVRWVGEGQDFAEKKASNLLSEIEAVKNLIDKDPLPTNRGKDFEAPASAVTHRILELQPDVATNREFWLWLSFVAVDGRFADIIDWRFGAKPPIERVNYGLGRKSEIWEGLFARLWLRGRIGFDVNSQDPYDIAKRGGIDIWRSHVIRQEYGRCPSVARALVRYQHPDQDPNSRTLTVKELRELAKRLRIVDASVSYEVLAEHQINEIIEKNVEIIRARAGDQAIQS